ncbi:hypothetical protein DAH24_13095 [Escherichia coli]|nr:hypothetical protein [Escherichia coli]TGG12967.1 hypothetical protein DAH24_13095 [Escherichia coli]TGG27212.1 hypothetical protein DAH26_13040 [Escherichia coli]TGG39049.1 hypothetical protein DAH23_13015 [Escherichia coli]TGJ91780.1 hypothetical protein DAH25_13415 [Escherichia coli]
MFCKESVTLKDVEQKLTTIIIFFASTTLKTTGYTHDDDDDKITKMRFFPRRPPRVQAHPTWRTRKKGGWCRLVVRVNLSRLI